MACYGMFCAVLLYLVLLCNDMYQVVYYAWSCYDMICHVLSASAAVFLDAPTAVPATVPATVPDV
jgi:hypothetical protein